MTKKLMPSNDPLLTGGNELFEYLDSCMALFQDVQDGAVSAFSAQVPLQSKSFEHVMQEIGFVADVILAHQHGHAINVMEIVERSGHNNLKLFLEWFEKTLFFNKVTFDAWKAKSGKFGRVNKKMEPVADEETTDPR